MPRGVTYINFRSPAVGVSASSGCTGGVVHRSVDRPVNEFAYPAQLAGMSFSFSKNAEGISLRLGGYTDKQQLLLQRLLEQAQTTDYSAQRFDNIRKDMIRALENSVAKRPSSQVVDDLNEALKYNSWGEEALIEALQERSLPTSTLHSGLLEGGQRGGADIWQLPRGPCGRGVGTTRWCAWRRPRTGFAAAQNSQARTWRVSPVPGVDSPRRCGRRLVPAGQ